MGAPKGVKRPSHPYSEEQAKRIEAMAEVGLNDDHIALIEGMSESLLKSKYGTHLKLGRAKGVGAVAKTLYQMALSGETPSATYFFLKCRGRWKEVHHVEHSGVDGKPIETKEVMTFETQWRSLPDKEGKA